MDQAFPIELTPPDPNDTEWTARSVGEEAVGDTAAEALEALGELLAELVEDSEYTRIYAPRVHEHTPGGTLPKGQQRHHLQLPKGEGGKASPTVHPVDSKKDSV
jgi:hypothetical protein